MAKRRTDRETRIKLSVLDRLVDLEPDTLREGPQTSEASLRDLKASIKRDLEWLLNSRRPVVELDSGSEESNSSILVYGMPDIVGAYLGSAIEQRELAEKVQFAVRNFATRLIDVKVSFGPPSQFERSVSFKIEAKIDVEPIPEPIVFDTVLQLGSGEFAVKES